MIARVQPDEQLRRELVRAAMLMRSRALVVSTAGNISACADIGMLITPTRFAYDEMRPGDIVNLDFDGSPIGQDAGDPSLDWRLHAAVYQSRPRVAAIAHTHSPHATARSFDSSPLVVRTEERVYHGIAEISVAPPAPRGAPS